MLPEALAYLVGCRWLPFPGLSVGCSFKRNQAPFCSGFLSQLPEPDNTQALWPPPWLVGAQQQWRG